jgi:hypothetical protein
MRSPTSRSLPSASLRIPACGCNCPTPSKKTARQPLTFDYEGVLDSADDSPVPGLKLAYVGDDTSYLLYAGDWFPVNAYGINRFTASINVTVPAHIQVIGSGPATVSTASSTKRPAPDGSPNKTYSFSWKTPSFPGTIVAGVFQEFNSNDAGLDVQVYFKPNHQNLAAVYADTAVREFTYFVTLYQPLPSTTLKVFELPDDTVPAAWAPEMAGHCQPSDHGEGKLPPARQHHCPPMVGGLGQPGFP